MDQVIYYTDRLKPATRIEVAYRVPNTLAATIEYKIRYDVAIFGMRKLSVSYRKYFKLSLSNRINRENKGPVPIGLDSFEAYRKNFNNNIRKKFKKGICYKYRIIEHYARECKK